jgi:hypothetical protein
MFTPYKKEVVMAKKTVTATASPAKISFFYRGKCTDALIKYILRDPLAFSRDMKKSVEAFGGEVLNCQIDATSIDPIGFLRFPTDVAARAWNIHYGSRKDVAESHIYRLLSDADLLEIKKRIKGKY